MPQVDELELVTTKRKQRFRLQSSESVSEEVDLGDDAAEDDDNEADEDDHLLSSGGKITNRYKSGNNLESKKRYFIIM